MDDCSSVRHRSLEDEGAAVAASDPDGGGVLPGEVENVWPASVPSCHVTFLEVTNTPNTPTGLEVTSPTGLAEGTRQQQDTKEGMGESEEVVPFTLDEDFDYDHVTLSNKHPMMKSCGSGQV